jgi:hypothetical protein
MVTNIRFALSCGGTRKPVANNPGEVVREVLPLNVLSIAIMLPEARQSSPRMIIAAPIVPTLGHYSLIRQGILAVTELHRL